MKSIAPLKEASPLKNSVVFRYSVGKQQEVLENALRLHNPGISLLEIERALDWAYHNSPKMLPKERRSIDNTFMHPLKMVEQLIIEDKADRETILAAILYPAFCNGKETKRVDSVFFQKKESFFDDKVRALVEATLLFRAQNLPQLKPEAQQERNEQINLFRLMSLWATRCDPRAILIRGRALVANLEKIADKPDYFTPNESQLILRTADLVYAQLTYIAGYGKLRSHIMDLSLKIQNRGEYNDIVRVTQERLGSTGAEQEANRKEIIRRIAESAEDSQGLRLGYDFDIDFRAKSPGSAYAKKIRKNAEILAKWRKEHPEDLRSDDDLKKSPELKDRILTTEGLGDLLAARIMIKRNVLQKEKKHKKGKDELSQESRFAFYAEWAENIYNGLSHKFGRRNFKLDYIRPLIPAGKRKAKGFEHYSYIQEQFARLAIIDPADSKDGKPVKDDRYDNYYRNRKPDGYAAIHDTLFIPLSGRKLPIQIELQIVDEEQHDLNTHGPRSGHIYYKSGLKNYSDTVRDWLANASALLSDKRLGKSETVLVFDDKGQIFDISDDPTVGGFFRKAGYESTEAVVRHPYFAPKPDKTTCGRSTRLENGSEIFPVLAAA